MRRNYIGPNLMNQVSVSPAALTSPARHPPSLHAGQTEASHFVGFSHTAAKNLLLQPIKNVLIL